MEKLIKERIKKNGYLNHCLVMLYFLFNRFDNGKQDRFEGNNYVLMRNYFARHLAELFKKYFQCPLINKSLLDVGGATGDFCTYFKAENGMKCVNVDPDKSKIDRANFSPSYLASGTDLSFFNTEFDVLLSRGVIEHVPKELHQKFINECYRVLKCGGIAYISSSPWYAPWAGHQLAPFHIFPIKIACKLTNIFFGKKYNYNSYADADLYYLSFRGFKKMLIKAGFKIVYMEDPITRWNFLMHIPVIREVLVQHMAFLVRK